MKLAFLISAHTDPQQLRRLVDALPDSADCYIHIDLKSDLADFTSVVISPKARFIKNRLNVVWGSWIEVSYQMELVRAALSSGTRYDYLITLSGLDYPVWSNKRIEQFFSEAKGSNILQARRMDEANAFTALYQEYRFLNNTPPKSFTCRLGILLRKAVKALGIKKPLTFTAGGKTYRLHKGAAWWAVTPELATFVLHEWDGNKELRKYFKTSFCPAETFVPTVAFNSGFASSCMLHEGQYRGLADVTPLTYIYYHPVIKIMVEEDYERIIQSGKMFCRKIVSGKSDGIVSIIDKHRQAN